MYIDYKEVKDEIKKYNRHTSVEFIIGNKCQNACKYCYRTAYQNQGPVIAMSLDKMKLFYDNAIEMGLIDELTEDLELFGGDPIIDIDYFNSVLKEFNTKFKSIVVPTNARVLENITDQEIDNMYVNADGKLCFSLSIDGPVVENINRPLSKFGKMHGFHQERDWSRLLHLTNKYHLGWHPMLDFNTSETWFDTWKWFVDNNQWVYLLEVRHGCNDDNKIIEGVYQLAKILKYCELNNIPNTFNTTKLATTGRGLPCSALTGLYVHYDGGCYFCHRVLEERFKYADLITKKININNYIALRAGFDFRNNIVCMSCPIRDYCSSMCVGAINEYWGKNGCISIPIPSTCKYFVLKYAYLSYKFPKAWPLPEKIRHQLNETISHIFPKDIFKILDKRMENDNDLQ